MVHILRTAFTGDYEPIPGRPDHIIAASFGAAERGRHCRSNVVIAEFAARVQKQADVPLLAQQDVAAALQGHEPGVSASYVVEGEPSAMNGGGLDLYGVLDEAHDHATRSELTVPLLVTHASLIGRMICQAAKVGYKHVVVPTALPNEFDPMSLQPWTRSSVRFGIREIIGLPLLAMKGKLPPRSLILGSPQRLLHRSPL